MLKPDYWVRLIAGNYWPFLLALLLLAGCRPEENFSNDRKLQIAAEIDSVLNDQYKLWYPRTIDSEHGGFFSRYSYDWQPIGPQNKFIVTQARHVWSTSKVAYMDDGRRDFVRYGRHGFEFLKDVMWDEEYGGFYQTVSREGEVQSEGDDVIRKELYGNAFGIYGLAAYYEVSENTAALDLAQQAFQWLEKGSYDNEYGGYFNSLTRSGEPYDSGYPKDYNSGIHILEALADLYRVWPDETVRDRLHEMFRIVRDTLVTEKGYMNLYFERDWTPVVYTDTSRTVQKRNLDTDHITFGHDIETAFLLIEAAHSLGFSEDSVLTKAKKMVDHTIENAWDDQNGGFYDRGYYFEGGGSLTVTDSSKVWWAQAEALHSLLMMADYFPDDPHNYFELFVRQWEYIKQHLLDPEYGGWYESGLDQDPDMREAPKAHIWKGNYHTIRALIRSKELLNEMARNGNSY